MSQLSLTDREVEVLKIVRDAGDVGISAAGICEATRGFPPETRIWTAQQAGRIAQRLFLDLYVGKRRTPQRVYYVLRSMGRGYLSVGDGA